MPLVYIHYTAIYGPFAVERYETTKKIKFMFISQKCSKYCNLSRFHINPFFIFFGVSYLSTAKSPNDNHNNTVPPSVTRYISNLDSLDRIYFSSSFIRWDYTW